MITRIYRFVEDGEKARGWSLLGETTSYINPLLLSSVNSWWTLLKLWTKLSAKKQSRQSSYDFLHNSNEDNCRYELNSWHYLPKHHESKTKWCKIPFSFTFPREILNAVDRANVEIKKVFDLLKVMIKNFYWNFLWNFCTSLRWFIIPLSIPPFNIGTSISSRFYHFFVCELGYGK